VHAVKQMLGDAFVPQVLENLDYLALRPNHANVARLGLHRPAQHPHIVAMSASHDHNVRRLIGREPGHGLLEILCDHFFGVGKTIAAGVGIAVINHDHLKTGSASHFVKIY